MRRSWRPSWANLCIDSSIAIAFGSLRLDHPPTLGDVLHHITGQPSAAHKDAQRRLQSAAFQHSQDNLIGNARIQDTPLASWLESEGAYGPGLTQSAPRSRPSPACSW